MALFKSKPLEFQEIKKLFLKGQLKKALKECKKFLSKEPDNIEALILMADILYKLGDKNQALETYKNLLTKLENEKYYDKLIALLKKIIKFYPDQFELYRKLADAFHNKGLIGEQLSVLLSLSEMYEKSGLIDKSIDILKEVTEIDKENLLYYKIVLERLDKFEKSFEICKFVYSALKSAYNRLKAEGTDLFKDYLITFSEMGLKHKCDLSEAVIYMIPYFEMREDKIVDFIDFAKSYFKKEFNKELYEFFKKHYPIEKDTEFYVELKDKYKDTILYLDLANYYVENGKYDSFLNLVKEINELPEYDFKNEFVQVAKKFYEKVDDEAILDQLIVLAGKCKDKILEIAIYNKLAEIYSSKGEHDKADRIRTYLNSMEYEVETDSGNIESDLEESFETDEIEIDGLDFGDLDIESEEEPEVQTNIDGFETTLLNEEEDTEEKDQDEQDIQLDLDGLELTDIEEAESSEENVLSNDFDLLDIGDKTETETETELDEKLNEVENLLSEDKFEKAKEIVDELLLEYPDNDKVKDYASKIFLALKEADEHEEVIDLDLFSGETDEAKSKELEIVENLRKSIDEVVSPDDYITHYDLGLAYFEMELLEDAINEFKKSAFGDKKYESYYMMAECYKKMGRFESAINVHKLILVDFKDDEKVKNSLYEIGLLYEMLGDKEKADSYFEKVYLMDPNFRDVKEKLGEAADKIEEQQEHSSSNKKKISFL